MAAPGLSTTAAPIVRAQASPFVSVAGRFYRAIARGAEARVLQGSVRAGRFSREGEAVLYLSASPAGVASAMRRHGGLAGRVIVTVAVDTGRVVDLRDPVACEVAGVRGEDALSDWMTALAAGREPASWRVADRLRAIGALGLIDPSRTTPGLWHLTLFDWGAARVVP